MTITDKTRKLLWGKSGSMCAICCSKLVEPSTPNDSHSIIGEECHIRGKEGKAARHDPSYPKARVDGYDNLLLLCRKHHKIVDDQRNSYTVEMLEEIKAAHEAKIEEALAQVAGDGQQYTHELVVLPRIRNGYEFMQLISGCHATYRHYDVPRDAESGKAMALFLELLQDWMDINEDVGEPGLIESAPGVTESIEMLEAQGYVVFMSKVKRPIRTGKDVLDVPWSVVLCSVMDSTDKEGDIPAIALMAVPNIMDV